MFSAKLRLRAVESISVTIYFPTPVTRNISILWDIMPYGLVEAFPCNVDSFPPGYSASNLRRNKHALFWAMMQRIVVVFNSGQPIDPIFKVLQIGPIDCPETSVRNYHYSLRNNPEDRSSQLLRGSSLKSSNSLYAAYLLSHSTLLL